MSKPLIGIVSSDLTDKTIVVTIETQKTHPLYKKQYKSSKKVMAHDEKNEAKIGDKVQLTETRPLSARKRHTLAKILEKAAISADKTVASITVEEQAGANEHPIVKEMVEDEAPAIESLKKAKK
jgi:small subunit ribosomal protein S17